MKILRSRNLGVTVSKLDPVRVIGRQITRPANGNVVVQGSVAVYGNDVRMFQKNTNVFIGVLADQLPRWWLVDTEPALEIILTFTSPGYVAPLGGIVRSGANIPSTGISAGGSVSIASSHPCSIWAEFNRPSVNLENPILSRFVPMAPTSRFSIPARNPATVNNPPFTTLVKTSATQINTNYTSLTVAVNPSVAGVMSGVYIEGSFAGSELGVGAAAVRIIDREPVYVIFYGAYPGTAGARGDVFYVGDISQPCPWNQPYAFKMVFGDDLCSAYDPAVSQFGLWMPHLERGENGAGLINSTVSLEFWQIGFDNADISIPLGTGSGPLAGQAAGGLQGEAVSPVTG
jgi:hypothetical protein